MMVLVMIMLVMMMMMMTMMMMMMMLMMLGIMMTMTLFMPQVYDSVPEAVGVTAAVVFAMVGIAFRSIIIPVCA